MVMRQHPVIQPVCNTKFHMQRCSQTHTAAVSCLLNCSSFAGLRLLLFGALTGHNGNNREGCKCFCRVCDVSRDDAINPNVHCQRIQWRDMKHKIEQLDPDVLRLDWCQHPNHLALFDIDFGGDQFGVFSAVRLSLVACRVNKHVNASPSRKLTASSGFTCEHSLLRQMRDEDGAK